MQARICLYVCTKASEPARRLSWPLKCDIVFRNWSSFKSSSHSRRTLIITLHKIRNNAKRYMFTEFGQIVQFRIRHDRWRKALTTHLYRVSLDLETIFINTGGNVPQIWKLSSTLSCKQIILSVEFVNILL